MIGSRRAVRRLKAAGVLAALMLTASPWQALAEDRKPDGAKGKALAEQLCSRCHAIGPIGASVHPKAPTFTDIVKRYDVWTLQEALGEGIVVGHPDMPKFTLMPTDIADLLTYMETLGMKKDKAQ